MIRRAIPIAATAALILFLELALIRYIAAYVRSRSTSLEEWPEACWSTVR